MQSRVAVDPVIRVDHTGLVGVADRIALLQDGEIRFCGDVSELDNQANDDMARYLGRAMVATEQSN